MHSLRPTPLNIRLAQLHMLEMLSGISLTIRPIWFLWIEISFLIHHTHHFTLSPENVLKIKFIFKIR